MVLSLKIGLIKKISPHFSAVPYHERAKVLGSSYMYIFSSDRIEAPCNGWLQGAL